MTRPVFEPSIPRTQARHGWYSAQLQRRGIVDDWIYVGDYPGDPQTTPLSPPFENGWMNEDTDFPLRFRWHHFLTGVEIDGGITGGTPPSVVFTLPPGQWIPDQLQRFLTPAGTAGGVAVWEIAAVTGEVTVLATT